MAALDPHSEQLYGLDDPDAVSVIEDEIPTGAADQEEIIVADEEELEAEVAQNLASLRVRRSRSTASITTRIALGATSASKDAAPESNIAVDQLAASR